MKPIRGWKLEEVLAVEEQVLELIATLKNAPANPAFISAPRDNVGTLWVNLVHLARISEELAASLRNEFCFFVPEKEEK